MGIFLSNVITVSEDEMNEFIDHLGQRDHTNYRLLWDNDGNPILASKNYISNRWDFLEELDVFALGSTIDDVVYDTKRRIFYLFDKISIDNS